MSMPNGLQVLSKRNRRVFKELNIVPTKIFKDLGVIGQAVMNHLEAEIPHGMITQKTDEKEKEKGTVLIEMKEVLAETGTETSIHTEKTIVDQ